MSLGEARVALEKVGLRLGGLTTLESVRLGDTVLTLQPSPGSWLAPGDAVDLTVASGSNRVPATTGLTQAEGVAAVQNAGFVVVVDIRADAAAVPGTVLVSLPGEATVLRLGTTVSITVAGAVAAPPTSTPSAVPGPTKTPQATATPPTVP